VRKILAPRRNGDSAVGVDVHLGRSALNLEGHGPDLPPSAEMEIGIVVDVPPHDADR